MFWSLCYLVAHCLFQRVVLRRRSNEFKELEIVVLRHQLAVLRRQTRLSAADHERSGLPCCSELAAAEIALATSRTALAQLR